MRGPLRPEDGALFIGIIENIEGAWRASFRIELDAAKKIIIEPGIMRMFEQKADAQAWLQRQASSRGFKSYAKGPAVPMNPRRFPSSGRFRRTTCSAPRLLSRTRGHEARDTRRFCWLNRRAVALSSGPIGLQRHPFQLGRVRLAHCCERHNRSGKFALNPIHVCNMVLAH
jgi:hypothetical protein